MDTRYIWKIEMMCAKEVFKGKQICNEEKYYSKIRSVKLNLNKYINKRKTCCLEIQVLEIQGNNCKGKYSWRSYKPYNWRWIATRRRVKGVIMLEIIKEVLELLERYFVYIYAGFVTILAHHFAKARGTKLNN